MRRRRTSSATTTRWISTGRAYFGDHLTDERLAETQSHPLYRHIQRLNRIRRGIPALQKAPMGSVGEWGSGMSFVRDWNNGESYAVVGLAMGSDQNITVGACATAPTAMRSPAA